MKYRVLGRTGFSVSEIGLGGEYLEGKSLDLVKDVISASLEGGVNIIDCFMSEPRVRSNIGDAVKDVRDKVYIQGHLRSIWEDGQYGRTLDIDLVKFFFNDLLIRMKTDYLDIGTLHMVDKTEDYDAIFNGPIIDYALALKEKGTIRALGISSHNPVLALKAVKTGVIDTILFSINPAYDVLSEKVDGPEKVTRDFFDIQETGKGINDVRQELYGYCEANGIGITVMKALAGGALLSPVTSPFGTALTVPQCLNYALSRPGVSSVLVGMQSLEEVRCALEYERLSDSEKDYSSVFLADRRFSMTGRCMYCNHCLPCSQHINIAQVNKYVDLASNKATIATLREHYNDLEHKASECIGCGICETNCPFGVAIIEKMAKAVDLFER